MHGTESERRAFTGVFPVIERTIGDVAGDDARIPSPTMHVEATQFDAFFATHHAMMVRALTLSIGDEQLGRDAAAEGFTRALQRWNRVSGYANPTGWIYRVGLNWALSRRRKTRREVAESADPIVLGVTSGDRDVDPRLVPALMQLSPDHRAVVVGRYYLDWSEQMIADALNIRPGTVKSRLSRALENLAEILGPA